MRFDIHAVDARQQVVALVLEAPSEADAAEAARSQGLTVLTVAARGLALRLPLASLARRRKAFPTLLFSVELRSLLDAGLNLVEALQTLAEKDARGERREVVSALLAALRRGEPFSQAVAAQPRHFSPLYVATVRASERTGDLPEALSRYIAYQEEFDKVKKKVISASIYPAILMAVGTLVLGFLMFYVVPRFARVYEDMAATLPFFSRLLLAFGNFVGGHAVALAAAGLALAGAAAWALAQARFRAWLNTRLWRVPALGERMKTYQLSRLYRTAGMLMRAGMPAPRTLELVRDLLSRHLQPALGQARKLIEQGRPMSAAFGEAGLATPVAARMMAVGERSGDMAEMLTQIARFHDEEVARFVDAFTRAFEPILMAVLGVAIGLVVVLMYMPIFELAGSIR